jgi:hypothetical protein
MECRCFQQLSVEHSHTRRSGYGRLRNTAYVKIDSLCGQRWPHEQHPGKYDTYQDNTKHGYSGVKESNGELDSALLSSMVRLSFFLDAIDKHVWRGSGKYHLLECAR